MINNSIISTKVTYLAQKLLSSILLFVLLFTSIKALPVKEDKDIGERLERVESNLKRLIELLAKKSDSNFDEKTRNELLFMASELKKIREKTVRQEIEEHQAETDIVAEVVSGSETMLSREEEAQQSTSMSGYMEMHINHDNLNPTTADFHRFVLNFGHMFGDRIRFWSELELEHAFVEGGAASGELELEQAFLDFLIDPSFNFRAGVLLTPIGIINERHEPTSFHGVERPFVDEVIIPTTWFGTGGGFVGDLGRGFSYKTYVMSSTDSSFFSMDEGFRDGRQKAFLENVRNLAWVGRLEYSPFSGVNLGRSSPDF